MWAHLSFCNVVSSQWQKPYTFHVVSYSASDSKETQVKTFLLSATFPVDGSECQWDFLGAHDCPMLCLMTLTSLQSSKPGA